MDELMDILMEIDPDIDYETEDQLIDGKVLDSFSIVNLVAQISDVFDIDINTADWTVHEDGYIYYNSILQPGEFTTPVFTEVGIVGREQYRGETLTLTVTAHATQSKNNPAENPWEAAGWPEEYEGAV